ncbi:methyltransferase-like protein 7A isoform X1 [Papaver somniferum]|uniref:methyltransferase-like protein 7A isoform X1 n=1 Tax=Papaver somniferum TaxID=3469 RepID=UPI000E7002B6|nr:methyltransferase-like protein 7A isoform X1 [Papaver somniferum]
MMHHSFSLLPQFSSSFLPSTRTLFPPNLFSTSTIPRCESSSKETGLEQSEKKKNGSYLLDSLHTSRFCSCGRRRFIGFSATSLLPVSSSSNASDSQSNSNAMLNRVHPPKPDWYEEFFALVMEKGMTLYEEEVAGYKEKLFSSLRGKCKDVLELGIGTGPNLKYYAGDVGVHVYGVDPNKKMEKYAAAAALAAGLPSTNFYYTQAVGEALPANDASMDAVVGTLVLCSVKDVKATLKEVKRVLKPGGLYVFMEHVAAEGGTGLRFVQNVADPLQQLLADGCHLTRETGKYISEAGFSDVNINKVSVFSASYISPHVYGTACK